MKRIIRTLTIASVLALSFVAGAAFTPTHLGNADGSGHSSCPTGDSESIDVVAGTDICTPPQTNVEASQPVSTPNPATETTSTQTPVTEPQNSSQASNCH